MEEDKELGVVLAQILVDIFQSFEILGGRVEVPDGDQGGAALDVEVDPGQAVVPRMGAFVRVVWKEKILL